MATYNASNTCDSPDQSLRHLKTRRNRIRVNRVYARGDRNGDGRASFSARRTFHKYAIGLHPLGRFGKPMEIAEVLSCGCARTRFF